MQAPHGPLSSSAMQPSQVEADRDRDRLFDLSLDLMCIAGLDGYFRQVNPSWTRVLGWSKDELLSRPISDFMHPEDRERTLRARADLARGIPVRGLENRYLCKDGSYRWLAWQSSIEPGAATVFAVARDITERRQSDHEHLILSKLESTGILAGGLAHDFNNLLTNLQLNLEMIGLTGPLAPHQKQHVSQAGETLHAARALTEQLLTFAQGGVSAHRIMDLKPLLQRSLDVALSGSNVRGESALAPDLWTAEVDEAQIGQVIRNLVLNAREAMPAGGTVRLRAENVVFDTSQSADSPPGDYVRITVTDEGAGIPPEVLPKIFDPYFSTKQRGAQKGMGLGLTICHSVLQKHGGTIAVESRPERGTTVFCHLPAARFHAAPTVAPAPVEPVRSRKILVMDDEPRVLQVVAQTLSQLGYEPCLAENGTEAVTFYEEALQQGTPFAAVLLDLTVRGGMGGREVVKILRERDSAVRAVLMTGYNHEETFRDHSRHGFVGALAKPFSVDRLRDKLTEVLGTPPEAEGV